MAEWKTGDVVGGSAEIHPRDRCYYRRNESGSWIPFPTDGVREGEGQRARTDEEISNFVKLGVLIIYPGGES